MKESIHFPLVALEDIMNILNPDRLVLKPRPSRVRNRFIEMVSKELETYQKELMSIKIFYAPKDENGEYIGYTEPDGTISKEKFVPQEQLSEEQFKKFVEDIEKLNQEEFIFEKNETNEIIYLGLVDILNDLDLDFKNSREAMVYDFLCLKFDVPL